MQPSPPGPDLGLQSFQREAVQRATQILERRRGVLVADSVGLGKTFIGLGLIDMASRHGEDVALVVPASLRRLWRTELRRIRLLDAVQLVSHTALALHGLAPPAGFIVVDEAHAFRNPRTHRYRALKQASRSARVVLLTATPVNNSLWDLYFQLRLFCADAAFRDLGIGSLKAAFADGRDVDRVLRAIMIRRTRAEVRNLATDLRFPARVEMETVPWSLPMEAERVREFLYSLDFVAHRAGAANVFPADVLRFALLKRLESSTHATRSTLTRLILFYEEFTAALSRGRLLRPAAFRSLYAATDDALQLVFEEVALEPNRASSACTLEAALTELATLRRWRAELSAVPDDKLERLRRLIAARPAGARTLVFTEYRDTARYLWTSLRKRFAVGMIDGAGAWIGESTASRAQVVERFAPVANAAPAFHPREAIHVLIATDVLAEGMNLQDADAVISYDLPWNPIRLIQRAGRLDRIGSLHEQVKVYNFLPDREFDVLLGLARTIRTKLETVRATVGLERPVLEPGEAFEEFVHALRAGDPGVLDALEAGPAAELRAEFDRHSVPVTSGVPISRLPGQADSRLLIGLAREADWDVVVIDAASGLPAPNSSADALLLAALRHEAVEAVDVPAAAALVESCLRSRDRLASTAPLDRRAPGTRLAAMVRKQLAALAASRSADSSVFARADVLLARLADLSDLPSEAALERLVNRRWRSIEELFGVVGAELSAQIAPGPKPVAAEENWRVTGVIVAD